MDKGRGNTATNNKQHQEKKSLSRQHLRVLLKLSGSVNLAFSLSVS